MEAPLQERHPRGIERSGGRRLLASLHLPPFTEEEEEDRVYMGEEEVAGRGKVALHTV